MKELEEQDYASAKKRKTKLPPQQSATDTSNWENRNISAPTIDKLTKKRIVRELEFIRNDDGHAKDIMLDPKKLDTKVGSKNKSK